MTKGWGPIALILAATFFVAWRGHKEAAALRAENRQLQARLAPLEIERMTVVAAPAMASTPAVSPELLRLRGEVAQLRRQTNEMQKLQAENAQLRTTMASAAQTPPPQASASDRNASPANFFPRETWAFTGSATPDDALRSVVWALNSGDLNTFLASLSPRERARTEQQWKDKTDEEIAAVGRRETANISGFHILDRQIVSEDEVTLRVFADGDEEDVRRMRMKRFGSEWKLDGLSKVSKRGGEQR